MTMLEPDLETVTRKQLEDVLTLISELATGRLDVRGTPSPAGDDIDAVMVGINMLAEDLEASHLELERRVEERTAQISMLNQDITRLMELGRRLQLVDSREDLVLVLRELLVDLFDGLSGTAYLLDGSLEPSQTPGTAGAVTASISWGTPTTPCQDPATCANEARDREDGTDEGQPCSDLDPGMSDSVCIAMTARGSTLGLLVLSSDADGAGLTPTKRRLGDAASERIAMALVNLALRERLRSQALRDPLTGLYNRRFVEEWIAREVSRTDRDSSSLGVLLLDIDHFKPVNDTFGHDVGDQVLASVADAIAGAVREGDVACRYGGEEFLVLLPGITRSALRARAEDMRAAVAAVRAVHGDDVLPSVTVSIGAGLSPDHGHTAEQLIRAADDALYAAKHGGRDQVRIAG